MKKIVWTLFLMHLSLSADVFDHLQPCQGKEEGAHSFGNIDCVYLINLDECKEKLQHCQDECKVYNINPYRFSAIHRKNLSIEQLRDVAFQVKRGIDPAQLGRLQCTYYTKEGEKEKIVHSLVGDPAVNSYFCHCIGKAAIAITLSHLSILQDAYDSNYETIWVMEDDIIIEKHPELLLRGIEELNKTYRDGWDVLFTDPDTVNSRGEPVPCCAVTQRPNSPLIYYNKESNRRIPISKGSNITTVYYRYGAYSMIISRSGIKKILDFYKENDIFLPYDMEYNSFIPLKKFAFRFNVVSHLVGARTDNYNY